VPSSHKSSAKPAPEKKVLAAKAPEPVKPTTKAPTKPAAPAAKPAPEAKPAAAAKPLHSPTPAAKPATKAAGKAAAKADALRARILERRSAKPIAFTLDEVREIAKVNIPRADEKNGATSTANKLKTQAEEIEAKLKKAAQPHFVKAASLADILGIAPTKQGASTVLKSTEIDPKFQRYYKLLIELREHVASGLDTHTEQTLKRSAKDDSGDLSGYAQHMADAGTDTFDRDFALSLVSNEQEALAEIEAAIVRIKNGTYGVCELTGKPINKERLQAVPFARFSVESQTEVERTKRRAASRAGLFGEGEEGGKIEDDGGGDE
jgi:RNA polymerase-binding transcription factor DksA